MSQAKTRLVRGIDPIPQNVELASGWAAVSGLQASVRKLDALCVGESGKRLRDLNEIRKACQSALDHIGGGFDMEALGPIIEAAARKGAANGQ